MARNNLRYGKHRKQVTKIFSLRYTIFFLKSEIKIKARNTE